MQQKVRYLVFCVLGRLLGFNVHRLSAIWPKFGIKLLKNEHGIVFAVRQILYGSIEIPSDLRRPRSLTR